MINGKKAMGFGQEFDRMSEITFKKHLFWYTRFWYSLWLFNFKYLLYILDEKCDTCMAGNKDLLSIDAKVKIIVFKRFPASQQKDSLRIWKRFVWTPNWAGKSMIFQLFPQIVDTTWWYLILMDLCRDLKDPVRCSRTFPGFLWELERSSKRLQDPVRSWRIWVRVPKDFHQDLLRS